MPISAKARFERNKLDKSKSHSGYLMVSLAANDSDFTRTPASFTLVLDVSGSMAERVGPEMSWGSSHPQVYGCRTPNWTYDTHWLDQKSTKTKLDLLKETTNKLIDNLAAPDEISIVVFDSNVRVLANRQSGSNKEALKNLVNSLYAGSSTNMSGGLYQALQLVNKDFKGVRRVMVLTDGIANVGVSDPHGLKSVVSQMVNNGDSKKPYCTLSTFGFGMNCNQELLADMSKIGMGNYYFIADGGDLQNTFAKELGGVLGCVAQNIEVKVKPNRGVKIESILNNFTVGDDAGTAVIKAEDIYASENKHILIKVALKQVSKPKPRPVSMAHVEVSFDELKSGKRQTFSFNTKIEYVKPEDADTIPVLEVAEQVAILEAAQAHKLAVKFANLGNFMEASNILRSASLNLHNAVDRGSAVACFAATSHDSTADNFTSQKYTASYGATVSASADSTLKTRVGTKGLSDVYMNKGAEDMTKAFEGNSAIPTPTPVTPTLVTPTPTVQPAAPEKKKGFAKDRE